MVEYQRSFEEFQAAILAIWNVAAGQLYLKMVRPMRGAYQDRLAPETQAALIMLKNPLHHEVGLILLPLTRDESRLEAIAFHRAQFLRMALGGEANDAIGGLEDRLGEAIVGFEGDHRRAGKFGGEIENVAHFGGAETVDALRIVTHDGKVAIERPHAMEN